MFTTAETIITAIVSNIVIILWEKWLSNTDVIDENSTADFIAGLTVKLFNKIKDKLKK